MTGLCNFKFYFIIQGVITNYLIENLQFTAKTFIEFIPNYNKPNQFIQSVPIYNPFYQNQNNQINTSIQFNPNSRNNYQNQNQVNINYYISQNNELKKQLEEEKRKNNILLNENNILKNINLALNNQIQTLKQYKEKNKLLQNEIYKKNLELQKYLSSNININNDEGITSIKPGEKVISVNFVSQGNQDIFNYSLPCKNTDLFVRLEEKLYNEYPKYKNYETYFEVKTKRIKRFKTLDENKIKNGDVINVFIA